MFDTTKDIEVQVDHHTGQVIPRDYLYLAYYSIMGCTVTVSVALASDSEVGVLHEKAEKLKR